jgi:hypothetical protein
MRFDFGKGWLAFRVPGLSVLLFYAQGIDRENVVNGRPEPTTHEGDLDIVYRIPAVRKLSIRFRNAYVAAGGDRVQTQFRIILNYELNLL